MVAVKRLLWLPFAAGLCACDHQAVVAPAASPTPVAVATPTPAAVPTAVPVPTPTPPNRVPSVRFLTNPEPTVGFNFVAKGSLTIHFNMCQSSDPDGDDITFRMDLDGNGSFEVDGPTGADCRRSYTYRWTSGPTTTSWDPKICATDLLSSLSPAHPYQCKTFNVKVNRS